MQRAIKNLTIPTFRTFATKVRRNKSRNVHQYKHYKTGVVYSLSLGDICIMVLRVGEKSRPAVNDLNTNSYSFPWVSMKNLSLFHLVDSQIN